MPKLFSEVLLKNFRCMVLQRQAKEFQLSISVLSQKNGTILELDSTCLICNRSRTTAPVDLKLVRNVEKSLKNKFSAHRTFDFKLFHGKFQFEVEKLNSRSTRTKTESQ